MLNNARDVTSYITSSSIKPLLLCGNALEILKELPDQSVDCCMTSPPYWNMREYAAGGIGLESTYQLFIDELLQIIEEVKRVLKDTGSFWLNIGDTYSNKHLLGIPWRVAIKMTDDQGWVLRNEVIWHKVKGGPDNAKDKLGNVHEQIFHFVKKSKGYYYNADAIRKPPAQTKMLNGNMVSATGVSGVRYKRQIELSTSLDITEKQAAFDALENILDQMQLGEIADFRMVIRGTQRSTHSDSSRLSGRAKELEQKGYYFLKYHKNGSKPRDVWEILPEDTQKRKLHYAAYPEELCRIPILATCPPGGIILDPFLGTGTTCIVANKLGKKSIGIDISQEYLEITASRLENRLS
ncbi:MAG TPA: site-specific DNA-methyltransferase [Bacillota bacterium]|nr:site-specific DNA-methyltransferase [Bacillota bacterium]